MPDRLSLEWLMDRQALANRRLVEERDQRTLLYEAIWSDKSANMMIMITASQVEYWEKQLRWVEFKLKEYKT